MTNDRPTGSITGQQDWEWNQQHVEQQSWNSSKASEDGQPSGQSRPGPRYRSAGQEATKPREIPTPKRDSTRREGSLQSVINHYERLLAEKNRQLANRSQHETERDGLVEVLLNVIKR